jgi:PAS domain S-box-containing protein
MQGINTRSRLYIVYIARGAAGREEGMISAKQNLTSIKEVLKRNPRGLSITDISRELNLNRNSVAKYVNMLMVSGDIEMRSFAAAKVYFLSDRVPISTMLDYASDMIVVLNSELKILQANDNFLTFAGKKPPQLYGRSLSSLNLRILKETPLLNWIVNALHGMSYSDEIEWKIDDRSISFQIKLIPTVFENGSAGVTLIFEDITEKKEAAAALKQSEARYRAIVEEQTDLICRFLPDGTLTFANNAYCSFFNMAKEEVIGHSFKPIMQNSKQRRSNQFVDDITPNNPVLTLEEQVIRPNGEDIWLQWTNRALFDDSGKMVEYQAVGREITELKHTEEQLKQTLKEKEDLVESVGNRTRGMFQLIQSLFDLQKQYCSVATDLGIIKEAQNRIAALTLIHEILEESADPEHIPIREYTQRLIELIFSAYIHDTEQVTIDQKIEDGLIQTDIAVPYGLILTELLTNSLLWGFPEGRRGTMTIEVACQDRSTILTISDDGVGLPDDLDPARSDTFGLDLVYTLIGQLGGTLDLQRKNGTSFRITIPDPVRNHDQSTPSRISIRSF